MRRSEAVATSRAPDDGSPWCGRLPTATGGIARLARDRVREAGIALEPLFKKAGLTAELMEDRGARIHVRNQIRFLELAAGALDDPFLGFRLAREFDLREIGLLHYVLASSDMLGDALQRAARYSTTVNEGVALRQLERNDLVMLFDHIGVGRHSDRQQIEFLMTTVVRACRELTGRHVSPHRVQLIHRRGEACSELNAFMGTDVEFGAGVDEIAFPIAVKDLPVVSADPYLNDLLVAYCEEALGRRPARKGAIQAAVENAIAPLLPHGKARAAAIARQLGMSQRTLARHLAAEGLTFGGVLDRLRCDLAQRHVKDPSLSISQIAWLLGYQEVSAFTHAFKRWTGRTPSEARAQDNVPDR
jgi:AraC-like DNA-binding protein